MNILLFAHARFDQGSELMKTSAIEFILKLSLEVDDGATCTELCKQENGLLELLG